MARLAVIDGQTVVNVINGDPDFTLDGFQIRVSNVAGPGWSYVGGKFSPPPGPDLAERKVALRERVNADRDRRIRSTFGFGAHRFDYDDDSQKRITGAGALATIAVTIGGKPPSDPRWHGGASDFVWIAADNSVVPMNAGTVLAFGQAAGAWESAHIFAAKALKDQIEAAPDAAALDAIDLNAGWPA